jgi:hypothetical protein
MLMPVRSGLFRSINYTFPYLSRGFIVILALVVVITSELSASTTRSAAPSPVPAVDVVSRAHKADRLPLPRIERADHELPVGCESVLGSFTFPVDPRCTRLPDLMEAIMFMPTEIIVVAS